MIKKLLPLFFVFFYIACTNTSDPANNNGAAGRDTSINSRNSYNTVFFDSVGLEKFIIANGYKDSFANRLRNFYNNRNFQYAWFNGNELSDFASTFYEMQNEYIDYAKDSTLYDEDLAKLFDSVSADDYQVNMQDSITLKTELMLTSQFFRYAKKAYQGNNPQINAKDLEWFIPRRKVDAIATLDSMLASNGKNIDAYEPVNEQYKLLKNYLLKYYAIQKQGGWLKIENIKKSLKQGDSADVIPSIKKRLLATNDFTGTDTSKIFTPKFAEAVKHFEHRYGTKEDGIVTQSLINEMNKPVEDLINTMLVNMERMRWMPAIPKTDYLLANIPEFKVHAYENGNYVWDMNVVVGKTGHNTEIFTGNMKYVVFSPYWNVPTSILKAEILPAIQRNPNYLASHNMEWNNGSVRQKPGAQNSLGLVKFLFPNEYNIYFHDTPAKSLFNEDSRAFSHGCIRLSEPKKLAEWLLRNNKSWTSDKISKAMNAGKEQTVTLQPGVPVFIGYFTAWVDKDGQLNFRNDIYGHDAKMIKQLFASKQ